VNSPRDQLFSRACFALDKNRGICRSNALDLVKDSFKRAAVSYDFLKRVARAGISPTINF
jgi:hypothetical protein